MNTVICNKAKLIEGEYPPILALYDDREKIIGYMHSSFHIDEYHHDGGYVIITGIEIDNTLKKARITDRGARVEMELYNPDSDGVAINLIATKYERGYSSSSVVQILIEGLVWQAFARLSNWATRKSLLDKGDFKIANSVVIDYEKIDDDVYDFLKKTAEYISSLEEKFPLVFE